MRLLRAGRTCRILLAAAALLVVCLLQVGHANASIQLINLGGTVEAQPGSTILLRVMASNEADKALEFTPEWDLPAGWRLVLPAETLTLEPGSGGLILASVKLPAAASAGVHELTLNAGNELAGASLISRVEVAEVRRITAIVTDAPRAVTGGGFDVTYRVSNEGNGREALALRASDDQGRVSSSTHQEIELEPGESVEVVVPVRPAGAATSATEHTVLLAVYAPEAAPPVGTPPSILGPEPLAVATASVEVIPQRLARSAAFHTFPLRLTTGGTVDLTNPPESVADGAERFNTRLRGRGPLWDGDPGELIVDLEADLDLGDASNQVQYSRPEFYIAAGDQSATLAPLLGGGSGLGLRAGGTVDLTEEIKADGDVYGLYGDGMNFGVAAGLTAWDQLEANVAMVRRGGTSGSTYLGTRARLRPELGEATRLDLDGELGLRLGGGESPAGNALRFDASYGGTMAGLGLSYRHSSAGFNGSGSDSFSVLASGNVSLASTPSLQASAFFGVGAAFDAGRMFGESRATGTSAGMQVVSQYRDFGVSVGYERSTSTTRLGTPGAEEAGRTGTYQALQSILLLPSAYGVTFQPSLTWSRTSGLAAEANERLQLGLQGSASAGLASGVGRLYARAGYDLYGQEFEDLSWGVAWSGDPLPFLSLDADAEVSLVGPELAHLSLGGTGDLTERQSLSLGTSAGFYRDRDPTVELQLSYSLGFDLPTSRRRGIGEVAGQVLDHEGRPLPGVVARLGDDAVLTDSNGRFSFPAVAVGEHSLTLTSDAMGPGELTRPLTPHVIRVEEHQRHRIDFAVLESARVLGQVEYEDPEVEDTDVLVGEGAAGGLAAIAGLEVVAQNGDLVRRTETNSRGEFALLGLPPGQWRVTVLGTGLSNRYQLSGNVHELLLAAGDEERVSASVRPVVRRIRFQEGGTLSAGK